jgi:signal transduction histidine kinase
MSLTPLKIATRVLLILGAIYLGASLGVVVLVNRSMKEQALIDAESKAIMLLNHNLAIHTYFSQQLKPQLFAWTDPIRPSEAFHPTWMSSTFAVRQINHYNDSLKRGNYYYKECAINARSPENEADAYEKSFLEKLKGNPKLMTQSEIRSFKGEPYLVTMRRGEQMEATCLGCHSTPDRAPGEMAALYGPERSFSRKDGETVSAISIRVPLASAYSAANRLSFQLSGFLLLILGALFGSKIWLTRHYIYGPIAVIQTKAVQIATSEGHLGETIPVPSGPELRDLTVSFNRMSTSLKQIHDTLDQRIEERTAALARLNQALEQDNAARKRAEEEIRRQSGQLRALVARLAEVEETGRQHLARELHDQVGQNLATLGLNLEAIKLRVSNEPVDRLLSRISDASGLVEQIGDVVRDLMEGLRPTVLDHYGLLGGLRWWGSQFSQRTGIGVDVRGEEVDPRLAAPVELALFRIVQEAMTNVAKHARASRVELTEA